MAKKLLAVYDLDLSYINRFVGYLKGKRNLSFRVVGFTELEALNSFVLKNKIDVLLISDNCIKNNFEKNDHEKKYPGSKEKNRVDLAELKNRKLQIEKIIILGEAGVSRSDMKLLNKYQSMENIIAELIIECQLDELIINDPASNARFELVGIYSPACDFRKHGFALALADMLSKNRSVLYINLERFSGLSEIFVENAKTISDIIYYYKTGIQQVGAELNRTRIRCRNFDVILPPDDLEDIELIPEETLYSFLSLIASLGAYEVIIVDMDEAYRKIIDVMDICSRVYIPVSTGALKDARMQEFEKYITLKEKENIMNQIRVVEFGNLSENEQDAISKGSFDYLEYCFYGKIRSKAEEVLQS